MGIWWRAGLILIFIEACFAQGLQPESLMAGQRFSKGDSRTG